MGDRELPWFMPVRRISLDEAKQMFRAEKDDAELLADAARAYGIEVIGPMSAEGLQLFNGDRWNPLTDDGDALRLAVKLQLEVTHYGDVVTARKWDNSAGEHEQWTGLNGSDPYAATRRAIVRAAASLSPGQQEDPGK